MNFLYLKVFENGDKSIGFVSASYYELAKSKIRKLSPLLPSLIAVYSLHGCDSSIKAAALYDDDLSQLELIWESKNV